MKIEIKVPPLGESVSSATVSALHKASGDLVRMDEEILELETDKVNQVLYAPASGILSLKVEVDDEVKIGQVLGVIEPKDVPAAVAVEKPKHKVPPPESPPSGGGRRLMAEDTVASLKRPQETKGEPTAALSPQDKKVDDGRETRTKMTKIRKVIAHRLVEAQQTSAMLTTFNEVDMSSIMSLREHYQQAFLEKYQVKLGLMSFFVKAVASALQAIPVFNAYIDGEEIVQRHYCNIGVAVSTDRGLVVPVLRDVDTLSYAAIEQKIRTFAEQARSGKLSVDDLQGAGFTITNGGTFGSLLSTPILNTPQPGILGMHAIKKRAVVIEDQVVVRPMMYLALSYDHRLVDGKEAVTFLVHVKEKLEDPARELLEV